jgi:hypothetical protein
MLSQPKRELSLLSVPQISEVKNSFLSFTPFILKVGDDVGSPEVAAEHLSRFSKPKINCKSLQTLIIFCFH